MKLKDILLKPQDRGEKKKSKHHLMEWNALNDKN